LIIHSYILTVLYLLWLILFVFLLKMFQLIPPHLSPYISIGYVYP
jgi:hypothetical protein